MRMAAPIGNTKHDTPEQIATRIRRRMRTRGGAPQMCWRDPAGDVFCVDTASTSAGRIEKQAPGQIMGYYKLTPIEQIAEDIRFAMDSLPDVYFRRAA